MSDTSDKEPSIMTISVGIFILGVALALIFDYAPLIFCGLGFAIFGNGLLNYLK